jgi:hypothetical protein
MNEEAYCIGYGLDLWINYYLANIEDIDVAG